MAKDLNLYLLKQGLPGIHAELPVDPFIRTMDKIWCADLDADSRIQPGGAEW